jgi:type IV pilus assembly protein PilP
MDSLKNKRSDGHRYAVARGTAAFLGIVALVCLHNVVAQADPLVAQMSSMRQESIKMSSVPDVPKAPISAADPLPSGELAQVSPQAPFPDGAVGSGYDPSGRRDPFAPVIQDLQLGRVDVNLPPLQRVTLTELNLIAIVWGAYGYTAMVQTPEGHGYTVKRGTRVGQNNGVVSAITERGIIVQERFTDVYGKKQEREYVKLLHPKEGSE